MGHWVYERGKAKDPLKILRKWWAITNNDALEYLADEKRHVATICDHLGEYHI